MEKTQANISIRAVWDLMETVFDPEVPVLSIVDLGIIRDIRYIQGGLAIRYTPTYSGCPAMDTIRREIREVLRKNGWEFIQLTEELSPAWTTDWMSEKGKQQLRAYGIAPPRRYKGPGNEVPCPRCGSVRTELLSQYGSTACKALYRCQDCLEPFEFFKCH